MFTAEELQKIKDLVAAGKDMAEVAELVGVSRATLERRAWRSGWKFDRALVFVPLAHISIEDRQEVAA